MEAKKDTPLSRRGYAIYVFILGLVPKMLRKLNLV